MDLDTLTVGLSGLNANSAGLDLIGNNLANLNTVGYKESQISFSDVLGQTFSTGSSQGVDLGMGVQVSGTQTDFSQGSIQSTGNPLDVAIQGNGFLVENSNGGTAYTRDGQLQLDQNNNLVSESGANVQGYTTNPTTGQIDPNLGLQNIQIPASTPATVTSQIQATMNLDAGSPAGTQFSTSFQIYDSLGTAHPATLTLQSAGTAGTPPTTTWNYDLTIPKSDIAGSTSSTTGNYSLVTGATALASPNSGGLVFNSNGTMTSAYIGATAPTTLPALGNLKFPPTGTTMPSLADGATLSPNITLNLVSGTNNAPLVTGSNSASAVTASSQNGAAAGTMSSVAVNADGTIAATYTNGQTVDVAQIAVAQFPDVEGLTSQGGGLYSSSVLSGAATIGAPGAAGAGNLVGGALEQSNVDLASELTQIITYQRGYEANAKTISTTDQLLMDALNLIQQ